MKRNLDRLSTKLTWTLLSPGNESMPGALAYTRDTDWERLPPARELAEKVAHRSNATTNGQNAEILDALARVLFLKGQWETAVDLQETAVRLAQGRQKSQFRETLGIYNMHGLPKPYWDRTVFQIESSCSTDWDRVHCCLVPGIP